ncbi:MAG: response regulator transcription factor [Verrucomicrobiota bacterium]
MKIAFLDDHPQLAEAIAEMIRQSLPDTTVDCFTRWADLEPELVAAQFDVLFLDMRLEDCLGAELIAPIQESSPQTRIVVLSAFAQKDLLLKCLNLGIAGYIAKTSPIELILKAIQTVIDGGTFFDENLRLGSEPATSAEPPELP